MMRIDQCFGDGKTEPQAAELSSDRAIALLKSIENMRKRFGLNTNPVVFYFENELFVCFILRPNENPFPRWRKLDRVADQVPKNLVQTDWIGHDLMRGCFQIQPHF